MVIFQEIISISLAGLYRDIGRMIVNRQRGTLIGAYEDEDYPVPPPTPLKAIEFVMDQKCLQRRHN
jgi:antitoxin component HigA of HigAB toxin-antitoxin module